jgi:hypothetical protein
MSRQVNADSYTNYNAFTTMCEALCLRGSDLVAVLTAYFDESYTQPNPKRPNQPLIYGVGCWLSTVDKWTRFDKRWNQILREAGIDHFHMSEFESRIPPYDTWSESKRIKVLRELWKAVFHHQMFGCSPIVHRGDWSRCLQKRPYLRNPFGRTEYGFDVQMAIGMINDWCDKKNLDGPIHYVFAHFKGQGNALDHIFKELLRDRKAKKAYRLTGMWTKGLAKDVSQLQAADMIAYEAIKRAANEYSPDENKIRKSLEYLGSLGLDYANFDPIYFDKDKLRELGNDVVKSRAPLAILYKEVGKFKLALK